ncbi:class III lanthionine synthetase LanKC [Plantibacter sp. VKM Ac-2885]|uniref:class III lanthionine synthetase LanKC n=1 Tax=Plantibacter sp. VKM Ac-2885 TaxID=2783828 RepID=UPI00188AD3E7|nr:class III lanthionine synthetase LanKC [Plantibacter sp. VKM Ac-2885]
MDHRYFQFSHPELPFYSSAKAQRRGDGFQPQGIPDDWRRFRQSGWEMCAPPDVDLPVQGWKIHVSATPDTAAETLQATVDVCVAMSASFKFVPTRDGLVARNSKSADRAASGKFVTVYPCDAHQLDSLIDTLSACLSGRPGPFILSDVRIGDGPLYLRYGGFMPLMVPDATDEPVLSLVGDEFRLTADLRVPYFDMPAEVQMTDKVRHAIKIFREMPAEQSPLDDYDLLTPLKFSNSGGVYEASSGGGAVRSIVKEARPLAGLDARGRDAVERLNVESETLSHLAHLEIAPRPIRMFTAWEHRFLEMEHIPGEPLSAWGAKNFPFSRERLASDEQSRFVECVDRIMSSIERCVAMLHQQGAVAGDLHPGNVLVLADLSVRLIDLEDGRQPNSRTRSSFNALGYAPPDGYTAAEADWFAVSRIAASLFRVNRSIEILAPGHWYRTIDMVSATFGSRAAEIIRRACVKLPRDLTTRVELTPAESPSVWDVERLGDPVTRDRLAQGILASRRATPGALFPGDVAQADPFGTVNVANGAAGVLLSLARADVDITSDLTEWLVAAADTSPPDTKPGLFNGLAGVAAALSELGAHDAARRHIDRSLQARGRTRSLNLFGGLAGIGLSAVGAALEYEDSEYFEIALECAARISAQLFSDGESSASEALDRRAGLLFGWSGISLFLSTLARHHDDFGAMRLAIRAVERDLSRTRSYADDLLGIEDTENGRTLPYLARGSAGVLVAIAQLQDRVDLGDDVSLATAGLRRACASHTYAFSGLFNGRAGILAALAADRAPLATDGADFQRSALAHDALCWRRSVQFPGENYLRLSTDLATGSAGILAALTAQRQRDLSWLPLMQQPGLFERAQGSLGLDRRGGDEHEQGSRPSAP